MPHVYSYAPEQMISPDWNQQYYNLCNRYRLPPDCFYNDPMILRSDKLIEYEHDTDYPDEISQESVLPSPTSSLDTTVEERSPEKKSSSFFNRMCSIM